MRALFTTQPAFGHFHPLLPVALAMREAGHQVAFCTAPAFGDEIRAYGFRFFGGGLNWLESRMADAFPELPRFSPEQRVWVVQNVFAGLTAQRMVPDLVSISHEWTPDVIVRESAEFGGCLAAESLGIMHAAVAAGGTPPGTARQMVREPLARRRAELGLPPDLEVEMPFRYLYLSFMPPQFYGPDPPFTATTHFLRHTNRQRTEPRLPAWVGNLPEGPVVLASLGTVLHRMPGVFDAILEGLRHEPVMVVLAIGSNQNPERFGARPPNVRIGRHLPPVQMLPRSDVFITHGGFNSVKEGLSAGVPLVVIPMTADQPDNAARCAALGLARVVSPHERTPETIRAAVREILRDHGYRDRAVRFQQEMLALPGPEHAVVLLERLAGERRPVSQSW